MLNHQLCSSLRSASSSSAPRVSSRAFSAAPRLHIARPIRPLAQIRSPRSISGTPPAQEVNEPSHAAVQPDIVHPYPEPHEFIEGDLGHSTDGPEVDVGRHTQRTLASFSMSNKVCVVTGAARGLGNLFARTFAESGSNQIVILDLDGPLAEQAAVDLVKWFEEHGDVKKGEISAIGMGCDVGNEESVKACVAKVVEKYGKIDVMVTAAGIVENFAAEDYPSQKIKKLLNVNIEGSYYCAREAAKDMMRRGAPGSIVMIGSMSGAAVNIPQPQAIYNCSKAGVRHLASSLAVEWATKEIRVNVISPGYMATALTRVILDRDPALKEAWTNLTPMGRIGEPEDLKGAIVYLASDASAFTTGADLRVDGGYTLT